MAFTICNYTEDDITNLKKLPSTYIVFGLEIAPTTGTPHIQGFLQMKPTTVKSLKRQFRNMRFASLYKNSTPQAAAEYCKKEDTNYHEHGTITEQGKRTDIADMREMAYEGLSAVEIRRENDAAIRYPFALQQLIIETRSSQIE